MNTLQDQPQSKDRYQTPKRYVPAQAGDAAEARQSQQQSQEHRDAADQQQSADGDTFTVSTDDWFKA
jgi:hypothetical protein